MNAKTTDYHVMNGHYDKVRVGGGDTTQAVTNAIKAGMQLGRARKFEGIEKLAGIVDDGRIPEELRAKALKGMIKVAKSWAKTAKKDTEDMGRAVETIDHYVNAKGVPKKLNTIALAGTIDVTDIWRRADERERQDLQDMRTGHRQFVVSATKRHGRHVPGNCRLRGMRVVHTG